MRRKESADSTKMSQHKANQNLTIEAAQPSIFKLDTDCWDNVFDLLSFENVYAFGKTCKAFQWVTGVYFQNNYGADFVNFTRHGIYIRGIRMNGLKKYAIKASFSRHTPNEELLYVGKNCKELKHVNFKFVTSNQFEIDAVRLALSNVEHLDLAYCEFDQNTWETFLECCPKLKRLKVVINRFFLLFPIRTYPTIQYLEIFANNAHNLLFKNNELTRFLENNLNIRSLAISFNLLWTNRNPILNSLISLEDLAIDLHRDINDNMINLLNNLYDRNFYKRLHLRCIRLQSPIQLFLLHKLRGLVTLYIACVKNTELPLLTGITELGINKQCGGIDIKFLAANYNQIRHLHLNIVDFTEILPFIRHSLTLKSVKIDEFNEKVLDVVKLNNERKKLQGARRVTMYVNDDVYLATKWSTPETILEFIEIRRQQSCNNLRPHSFW